MLCRLTVNSVISAGSRDSGPPPILFSMLLAPG